jgi:hypothetical protein
MAEKQLKPVKAEVKATAAKSPKLAPTEKKSTKSTASKPSEIISPKTLETPVEKQLKNPDKKNKNAKKKVIRDSFSFPEQDYLKISELKKICLAAGMHVKKGEILRAGLHLLCQLKLDDLKKALEQVEKVQTGRPNSTKN